MPATTTVAVVGASGATGRAVTRRLTEAGHRVVAVCRTRPDGTTAEHRPTDALDPAAVDRALAGISRVVVALGIAEDPLAVRLRGARGTSSTVRSEGTANVVRTMGAHGGGRLVVLSSYGIGDSAPGLSVSMRAVFTVLLAPQMRDHAEQERIVRESGLDWTIARPVNLVDEDRPEVVADPAMRTVSMAVGREQVAERLAHWATSDDDLGRAVALSS
jgi:uncharacterized protein YbjT (DUF2867 family)